MPDQVDEVTGVVANIITSTNASQGSEMSFKEMWFYLSGSPNGSNEAWGQQIGGSGQIQTTFAGSGWENWGCSACMTTSFLKNASAIAFQIYSSGGTYSTAVSTVNLTAWFYFTISLSYISPTVKYNR